MYISKHGTNTASPLRRKEKKEKRKTFSYAPYSVIYPRPRGNQRIDMFKGRQINSGNSSKNTCLSTYRTEVHIENATLKQLATCGLVQANFSFLFCSRLLLIKQQICGCARSKAREKTASYLVLIGDTYFTVVKMIPSKFGHIDVSVVMTR